MKKLRIVAIVARVQSATANLFTTISVMFTINYLFYYRYHFLYRPLILKVQHFSTS